MIIPILLGAGAEVFVDLLEIMKSPDISKQIDQSPNDGQVTGLIVFSSSGLQAWEPHMIHSYKSCFRIPIGMGPLTTHMPK